MSIPLENEDTQIIIDSLLLKIKIMSAEIQKQAVDSDNDNEEKTTEILGLYRFIESKDQVSELLDFFYDKAKNGDHSDVETAIRTFDYYTDENNSEERWQELMSMQKALKDENGKT